MLSDRTIAALTGVSKATLNKGVRIKHLFRIMTNYEDLWLRAYANLHSNRGATTRGVDETTLDGLSIARIRKLTERLKNGTYKPQPTRRTYIPKTNGKKRPLGIPTGDDKLVQEVIKILLEFTYEPIFSDLSHGFRPQRSCHTALADIKHHWKGTKWVVDMDIEGFYDNIDHETLVSCLEKKIDDRKFIGVIKQFLKAGYLEDWQFVNTYSGTPQGGNASPILANIVLNELDQFIEDTVKTFEKGRERKKNREYVTLTKQIAYRRSKIDVLRRRGVFDFVVDEIRDEIKVLEAKRIKLPAYDVDDPNYKRLRYVRYADDFALGVIGTKQDALEIMDAIRVFLRKSLRLTLSDEKSGIRHIKKGFGFLGYHISLNIQNERVRKTMGLKTKDGRQSYKRFRSLSSQLQFQVPKERVWEFCRRQNYLQGKWPQSRTNLVNLSDFEIISTFNAEMRGFANYYCFTGRRNLEIMEWAGLESLFKTLAHKHKTSSQRIVRRMKHEDDHIYRYEVGGKSRVLKVFKLKHRATEPNHRDKEPFTSHFWGNRSEIVERLNARKCEYCGTTEGSFEVHHIRKLKDIKDKQDKAFWEKRMIARNRKTMVLCEECHRDLHRGKLQGWKRDLHANMESRVQ